MHAGGEYHGHWRGTPHYLCPELKAFGSNRGVLKYGDRVDVYAIGMTMKEVVAVSKINRRRTWQRNFEQLVQQMLHSDPSQRPTAKGITARLTPPPAHLTPAPTARLTPLLLASLLLRQLASLPPPPARLTPPPRTSCCMHVPSHDSPTC